MNAAFSRRLSTLACLLLAVAGISSAAQAAPAGKASRASSGGAVSFERTKTRIDSLLAQRLKPDPLPNELPSLFVLPDAAVPLRENDTKPMTERLPPTSDSELLLYYGAGLRISGTVRINDVVHLVINQSPYKEGDILTIKTKDAAAKLRVIAIAPGELTLGLNDAVQIIKFKK